MNDNNTLDTHENTDNLYLRESLESFDKNSQKRWAFIFPLKMLNIIRPSADMAEISLIE